MFLKYNVDPIGYAGTYVIFIFTKLCRLGIYTSGKKELCII